MAVEPAGKHHAQDRRHCGRLRWAAARPVVAARMRRVPDDVARRLRQGIEPAAFTRIELHRSPKHRLLGACGAGRHRLHADVGHRDIDVLVVGGHAPLHAAKRRAAPHPALPQDGAVAIGIERMDHAGFLPGNQRAFAAGEITRIADEPKSKSGPLAPGQFMRYCAVQATL